MVNVIWSYKNNNTYEHSFTGDNYSVCMFHVLKHSPMKKITKLYFRKVKD